MIASEHAAISAPARPWSARATISISRFGASAAGQRGEPEQHQRSDERAALAEVVGGAAAEHQEAGEGDRVGVDDPLQVGRGEAEARLDRGQRDVDDAQVEDDHELRHAAHGQQPAPSRRPAPRARRRGRRRRHRGRRRLDAHEALPACAWRRRRLVGWGGRASRPQATMRGARPMRRTPLTAMLTLAAVLAPPSRWRAAAANRSSAASSSTDQIDDEQPGTTTTQHEHAHRALGTAVYSGGSPARSRRQRRL